MPNLYPTLYCWRCGHPCKPNEFFCCKKHQQQYERNQDRQIIKGKRAGYGIVGSTH